jgi:multidrug efflux pump subunit AcrA (membrane-fusion protein)
VKLTSEIPGRIQKIYVEPGEEVRKGQALLLIERQLSEPRKAMRYSPLKGVIADIPTRVGETVHGGALGTTLMTIADMSRIYVEVNVDEADISKIAVGHPARIIVDAFHEKKIRGLVIRKDSNPVAQSDPKEFRVTLEMREFPQAIRNRLRPGMSATAMIATSTTFLVRAVSPCKRQTIEALVKAIAEAYEAKTLASLDSERPYLGKVRVVIEHSLADDNAKDRFLIGRFTSLAKAEAWLKSRAHEEMPGRSTKPLTKCAKGVCTYNFDGGILHNNLYLKKNNLRCSQ